MAPAPVFQETYEGYLRQVAHLDLNTSRKTLGYAMDKDEAVIPLFNKAFRVSHRGVFDEIGKTPDLTVSVVLLKYLLMCPAAISGSSELVTFKDFKDAAPLIHFFTNSVEGEIVRRFSGGIEQLESSCIGIGGESYSADLAYQVKYRFFGLPKIPVILLFNDAEEGFSAQCTILFERSAENYLDMECLSMVVGMLVYYLKHSHQPDHAKFENAQG